MWSQQVGSCDYARSLCDPLADEYSMTNKSEDWVHHVHHVYLIMITIEEAENTFTLHSIIIVPCPVPGCTCVKV